MADHRRITFMISLFAVLLTVEVHGHFVDLTILESAVSKGAVCLDGSPPGYYFHPGQGDGVGNWIVSLSGGGWCNNVDECTYRFDNGTGSPRWSSLSMSKTFNFTGVLSPSEISNPYFYNWNRIFVSYCDGASFLADVEQVLQVNPTTSLHFRGARIFKAVIEDLLEKGMKNANNAILLGSSAGGMSTLFHCDEFRGQLPNTPRVKCISESGLFFRGEGVRWDRERYFKKVVDLHGLINVLPQSCTSKMDPQKCIFAENFIGDIKTPLFMVQSQFDWLQLTFLTDYTKWLNGNKDTWRGCVNGTIPCLPEYRNLELEYQKEFLAALPVRDGSQSRGLYIDSCLTHDHSSIDSLWNGRRALSKTLAEAVRDWYFDRCAFQEIESVDHPVSCPAFNY